MLKLKFFKNNSFVNIPCFIGYNSYPFYKKGGVSIYSFNKFYSSLTNERRNISSRDGVTLNLENILTNDEKFLKSNVKYLRDISLKPGLEWTSGKGVYIKIGNIGNTDNYDYTTKSLLNILEFNDNVKILQDIFNKFNKLNSYAIVFLIRISDDTVVSLDRHYLVNNTTNVENLLQEVYKRIDFLTLKYNFEPKDQITVKIRPIQFKVKDPKFRSGRVKNTPNLPSGIIKLRKRLLTSDYIPHTMNLSMYGYLLLNKDSLYLYDNGKVLIKVEVVTQNEYHKLKILSKDKLELITEVEDLAFEDTFIRKFIGGKQEIVAQYSKDYKLINLEYYVKVDHMKKYEKALVQDKDILSFDLECYTKDINFLEKISTPYACGFFDGKSKFTYYKTDFENEEQMLLKCLNDMMCGKYHKYTVYCHNLSKYDLTFLHKIFHKYFNVSNIVSKERDIISISITSKSKVGKIKPKLIFNDSICILPSSLEKLGKSFNVETIKGVFPYSFVNENNLNYKGPKPDINFFNDKVTKDVYNNLTNIPVITETYKDESWSMRDETILYLEKDLISLYQIINKMSDLIFKSYKINITNCKTISSLALSIYRSNFLDNEHMLAHTEGDLEKAVRSAYFGGRNEVFVPCGKNLYSYDYNSLYPTAMLQPMPVGNPLFSLCKDLHKIFGFVKAKVTVPGMNIPPLPCRTNIDGVEKLTFPIGTWTGWWFSELLKLAEANGCQIEVQESYIFEKGYGIFDEYVKTMAAIKDNTTGAMREIHKLLLNTLFGKMGMKDNPDCIKVVSSVEAEEIHLSRNVIHNFRLDENKEYIRYHKKPDEGLCEQSGIDYEKEAITVADLKSIVNTSTPIAAATTSWAMILMYNYIKNSLYTDTDSIFIKEPLNGNVVGSGLGKFKLEYGGLIKNAIFPSAKLYLLETNKKGKEKFISKRKGFSGRLSDFEYLELYKGGGVEVFDTRWKRNLELGTVILKLQKMKFLSNYDKRQKIYSMGKWVKTSPLCINSSLQIVTTALSKIEVNEKEQNSLVVLSTHNQEEFLTNHSTTMTNHEEKIKATISTQTELNFQVPQFNQENKKLHSFEKLVNNAIHESNMLAGNQATILIFKLTGIMHEINGDMYYYIGKSHKSKRVFIRYNGKWLNSNLSMKSGRLMLKSKEKTYFLNYFKSNPPDINKETKSDEFTRTDWVIIIITHLLFLWEYSITSLFEIYWLIIKIHFLLLIFIFKLFF